MFLFNFVMLGRGLSIAFVCPLLQCFCMLLTLLLGFAKGLQLSTFFFIAAYF